MLAIIDPISAVSVTIGLLAIALSVLFFCLGLWQAKQSKEAFHRIDKCVSQSETLFRMFYDKAFGMMKDGFDTFREHAFSKADDSDDKIAAAVAEKIEKIRAGSRSRIWGVLDPVLLKEGENPALRTKITRLLDETITEAAKVEPEARGSAIRRALLRVLPTGARMVRTDCGNLAKSVLAVLEVPTSSIYREIFALCEEGIVESHSSDRTLAPTSGLDVYLDELKKSVGPEDIDDAE